MAKFLLRCAEDVDIFHAAAVIAGSVMRIALEMSLMIRAFEQTHASRYNNLCVVSDAVCTTSLAWLQSLNVIIDDFTFVLFGHDLGLRMPPVPILLVVVFGIDLSHHLHHYRLV